ncbi:VanZ family protein [Clostridium thermobutyricum]|uniref:VanZ family protein n=1 Tax=Clostridium thermobutyricum TaxID=29372 RepID=UPI0018AAAA6A|nr:VanZ family protein [Clostridium thermobutyricum]
MYKKNRIIFSWIILVIWMIFIFYMSAQPADISNSQSGFVIKLLKSIGIDSSGNNIGLLTTIVRKGAHFSEYAILGLLSYNVMKNYFTKKRARIVAVLIVFFYACSDEFHQLFVSGRAGKITDVIIDTSGGIFSVLIIWIINLKNKLSV